LYEQKAGTSGKSILGRLGLGMSMESSEMEQVDIHGGVRHPLLLTSKSGQGNRQGYRLALAPMIVGKRLPY